MELQKKRSSASPAKKTSAAKKAKAPAKAAKAKAPKAKQDKASRIEAVRRQQLEEGNFDCFARALDGYCDQGGCVYYEECLIISRAD